MSRKQTPRAAGKRPAASSPKGAGRRAVAVQNDGWDGPKARNAACRRHDVNRISTNLSEATA